VAGRVLRVLHESEGPVAPGTPLLELADPAALELVVDVPTADAVAVREGVLASIERWGGEGALRGHVRLVEPAAFTKISALGVEEQRQNVVIDLDEPRARWAALGDGHRVEARVVIARAGGALHIPSSVLFRDGAVWVVFVVDGGVPRRRRVSVGLRSGVRARGIEGLGEADVVIVHPATQWPTGGGSRRGERTFGASPKSRHDALDEMRGACAGSAAKSSAHRPEMTVTRGHCARIAVHRRSWRLVFLWTLGGTWSAPRSGMATRILPSGLTLSLGLALAGCGLSGGGVDLLCLEGEACSSDGSGLLFLGASMSDGIQGANGGVETTAVGGTQAVRMLARTTGVPFNWTIEVQNDSPDVLAVPAVHPPDIDVRGVSAGAARLHVVAPETGAELDQVELRVGAIAAASAYPLELASIVDPDADPAWAVLAGSSQRFVVRLMDAAGGRLVDQSLALTSLSGPVTAQTWDLYAVDVPSSGDVALQIEAGGASFEATAHAVAAVDDFTVSRYSLAFSQSTSVSLPATTYSSACFVARSSGAPTAGAEWVYTASPGIDLERTADEDRMPPCVAFKGTSVGTSTLTVSTGGAQKTFTVVVTDPPA
jgi:hypothetical protein